MTVVCMSEILKRRKREENTRNYEKHVISSCLILSIPESCFDWREGLLPSGAQQRPNMITQLTPLAALITALTILTLITKLTIPHCAH